MWKQAASTEGLHTRLLVESVHVDLWYPGHPGKGRKSGVRGALLLLLLLKDTCALMLESKEHRWSSVPTVMPESLSRSMGASHRPSSQSRVWRSCPASTQWSLQSLGWRQVCGDHQVEVSLLSSTRVRSAACLGKLQGDPSDDFLNPDGEPEPDSTSLGSWQVANLTRFVAFIPEWQLCPGWRCRVLNQGVAFVSSCSSAMLLPARRMRKTQPRAAISVGLTDVNGPFRHCHSVLDPAGHFESCLYDQCALHLDPDSLCRSLQSHMSACQSLGVAIEPWRNATFCLWSSVSEEP
ncbi:hypothetical protein E2320_009310 [Naja naja]|nr:hypothetical protein E2320_009310 [Naja naja]